MGNQTKIEIINDYVWYRKGDKMSALDVLCKFVFIASKAISADPTQELQEKSAKQLLMQLIFDGTGVLITDSGNISTRKEGGLQKGETVKIKATLKMGSSTFDLKNMIETKDYASDFQRVLLKNWNVVVPTSLSKLTDTDFIRAIESSSRHNEIDGHTDLIESLHYAFIGVHRKDNPKANFCLYALRSSESVDVLRTLPTLLVYL